MSGRFAAISDRSMKPKRHFGPASIGAYKIQFNGVRGLRPYICRYRRSTITLVARKQQGGSNAG
jgi:hypothetical protein